MKKGKKKGKEKSKKKKNIETYAITKVRKKIQLCVSTKSMYYIVFVMVYVSVDD